MDYIININITNYCQSKCVACPRTNTDTLEAHSWLDIKHANLEDVKKMINNICKLRKLGNTLSLKLCGDYGDPMMHPDIEHIIYYANLQPEIGHINVATNGGLRTNKFYEVMGLKYKKLNIVFGIDGTTAELNHKYREGVNFEKAWTNMMSFYENAQRGKCTWQFLVFQWNIDDIENAFKIASDLQMPLDVHRGNGTFGDVPVEMIDDVDDKIDNFYRQYLGRT